MTLFRMEYGLDLLLISTSALLLIGLFKPRLLSTLANSGAIFLGDTVKRLRSNNSSGGYIESARVAHAKNDVEKG
jgi:hypothetical protein